MPEIRFDTQFSGVIQESIIKAVFCKNVKIPLLQETVSPGPTTLHSKVSIYLPPASFRKVFMQTFSVGPQRA